MNSDCAFFIGADHKICQDYAVACNDGDMSYVIIADGCSSSPDTDIGARFLVKAAETHISHIDVGKNPLPGLEKYHQQSVQTAAISTKFLQLDPSCLDATILTVKAKGNRFVASCYGDGVVALARRDGKLALYSIEFVEGYPQYVSYTLDEVRKNQFDDKRSTNFKEVTYQIIPDPDNNVHVELSENAIEFHCGQAEDYHCAAVLSDGVHSFTETLETESSRTTRMVPMTEVVSLILAFKTTKGDFVYRRMQAFQKICATRRWQHHDDLSVGVIYLGR